ncbi:MAG: molybdopterin converting factor subunit 1 [Burkholderiales bacterium]|nr:molybdopterin converting factor subunit 1 [Burkholderiales bacterium]
MNVRLLYFARLREAFGIQAEEVALPEEIRDVGALSRWLQGRGGAWRAELAPGRAYRVAVDQEMAGASTRLHEGAEVAVFPPVTGG